MAMLNSSSTPCALLLAIGIGLIGCGGAHGNGETGPEEGQLMGVAKLEPKSGSSTMGDATFTKENGDVTFHLVVTGATPGTHAVHIHENSDCSAADAESAGPHWNPTGQAHGKWGEGAFHLGDIGNMEVDASGRGEITLTTDLWSAATGLRNDVLGHSVVVHAGADDYTSQPAGAAGARVSCGVIRRATGD